MVVHVWQRVLKKRRKYFVLAVYELRWILAWRVVEHAFVAADIIATSAVKDYRKPLDSNYYVTILFIVILVLCYSTL